MADGAPLLALDMYEHAYHMDQGAKAAAYVDIYMDAIRWDNATKLATSTVATVSDFLSPAPQPISASVISSGSSCFVDDLMDTC